jgi:hypothetical protein
LEIFRIDRVELVPSRILAHEEAFVSKIKYGVVSTEVRNSPDLTSVLLAQYCTTKLFSSEGHGENDA